MRTLLLGRMFSISATLVVVFLTASEARAQNVIIYGNGGRGYAVPDNYTVRPYTQQQYPSRNGYSRVTPQSRVTAYDRVTPQPYRGARQLAPSIRYNTHQDGYFYGSDPAYGYGLSYGTQAADGYTAPRTIRPSSRNRVFRNR